MAARLIQTRTLVPIHVFNACFTLRLSFTRRTTRRGMLRMISKHIDVSEIVLLPRDGDADDKPGDPDNKSKEVTTEGSTRGANEPHGSPDVGSTRIPRQRAARRHTKRRSGELEVDCVTKQTT